MRYLWFVVFLFYALPVMAREVGVGKNAIYEVKVAQTEQELRQGLMFVKEMPKNAGMWFDLRAYPGAVMWMKDTYIPLDMLFIGCHFKVVDIKPDCKPLSLDKIETDKPFCYVLEINGGEAVKNQIKIGDDVYF